MIKAIKFVIRLATIIAVAATAVWIVRECWQEIERFLGYIGIGIVFLMVLGIISWAFDD
nr:MAG TPA: hypothetical protein [Caudoviricetes sp.]